MGEAINAQKLSNLSMTKDLASGKTELSRSLQTLMSVVLTTVKCL